MRWVFEGDGLAVPVVEALSIDVLDAAAGRVSMPAHEYAANSFGAVQGGVMALLADVAGAEAVGAAQGDPGGPVVVTDLQVAYLALGRVGPIESRATVLDSGGGRPPRSAVVELVDAGADDRLTTVVSVGTLPAADGARTADGRSGPTVTPPSGTPVACAGRHRRTRLATAVRDGPPAPRPIRATR